MDARTRGLALCLAVVVALVPSVALAKVKKKTIATIAPGQSALALDANGMPHVAFQSPDHRPYHATKSGRKIVKEQLEDVSDAGWASALAVDSTGRVHQVFHAERMVPSYAQALVYAYSDGAGWTTEEVKHPDGSHVGGYATSLVLDADDQIHVLYTDGSGNLEYAQREDVGWEFHALGFVANWFRTTSLALDADGNAHACYTRGAEAYYATNAEGDWVETSLGADGRFCALALDGADLPRVAVLSPDSLSLFRHDGMGFDEETVSDFSLDLPGLGVGPDGLALALATDGRPHLVVTLFISSGSKGAELQLFVFHDGEEWRGEVLGEKDEGYDPVLAIAPDGSLHGIWRSGGESKAKLSYFLGTFPDLSGSLSNLTLDGDVLRATLTVQNEGTAKSKKAPLALYLSDDEELDVFDERLPDPHKVGAVKPGSERIVALEVGAPAAHSGQYLIAVIDPGPEKLVEDLDHTDNTVAAPIP